MNLKQAKILLGKIDRLVARMDAHPNYVSSIEKNLMLRHLEELYEVFLEASPMVKKTAALPSKKTTTQTTPPKTSKLASSKPSKTVLTKKTLTSKSNKPLTPPVQTTKPIVTTPNPPQPKPIVAKQERPKPTKPKPPVVTSPKPKPIVPKQERPKPTKSKKTIVSPPKPKPKPKPVVVTQKPAKTKSIVTRQPIKTPQPKKNKSITRQPIFNSNTDFETLFEIKVVKDLSQKLSESPIYDLRTAFGINERIAIINQLFNKNAQKLNETLTVLNNFDSFSQAKAYLIKIVIPEYDWLDRKRKAQAKAFIKKVNRRYKR